MKDGGNMELVVQNVPIVQKKAVVIYVQGLILLHYANVPVFMYTCLIMAHPVMQWNLF